MTLYNIRTSKEKLVTQKSDTLHIAAFLRNTGKFLTHPPSNSPLSYLYAESKSLSMDSYTRTVNVRICISGGGTQ